MVPGQTIAGRYVVTSHLGSGGMGDVFEVEHTLLGKRFALKRLSEDMASDREMVERFMREARAAAATGHPGIVDVIDLGIADDGLPFLVMEKLSGETLRRRLDRGPLDEQTLVRLGRAVLGALAAVHRAAIIHRDIKPENLFLCRDGRVKILDFGLAHRATVDVRLTQSGAVMGTPLYMSPEQARGEECDARTDLYAVGAVLYECASGRPPFTAAAYSVLVAMILEIDPNPAHLVAMPLEVREVILAALRKARDARPPDAETMRAALGGDDEDGDDARWTSQPGSGESGATISSEPTLASPRPGAIPRVITDEASAPTMMPNARTTERAAPARVVVPAAVARAAEPAAVARAAEPATAPPEVAAVAPKRRSAVLAAMAVAIMAAVALIVVKAKGGGAGAEAAVVAEWQRALVAGELDRATEEVHQEALRAPADLELAGRDLLLALLEDRNRAFAQVKVLEAATGVPPFTAAAMAAVRAMARGQPALGAEVLGATAKVVTPGSVDDLVLRQTRATLWRLGDRFDLARPEYVAILARWPGFSPALEGLVERLLFLDEIDEAQGHVEAYIAAAPTGTDTEMMEIELLFGQRRYRDALARIERRIAANPGRETEAFQFRGDLRLLLGDPTAAISAYDTIEDEFKRGGYVAGALATQGRYAEARALLVDAMARYPKAGKLSRLAKLMTDATLLALETGDAALADVAVAATTGLDLHDVDPTVQNAAAFALGAHRRLAGEEVRPDDFSLGAESPLYILLRARDASDTDAVALLRAATTPASMHFGVIVSHVYPALWLERGRLELSAGDPAAALDWLDRVIRPRHYDSSRGPLIARALTLKAATLAALSRPGEAAAIRRELSALQPPQ